MATAEPSTSITAPWPYGNGYGVRGVNGSFTVQNSTIENNNNYGLYLSSSTPPIIPVVKNNAFLNNTVQAAHIDLPYITLTSENLNGNSGTTNGLNGLVLAGALDNSSSLAAQPGFSYILSGIDIINNATLTLDAGAVLKMVDGTGITVTNGILTANGVLGSPVTITSLRDDSIDGDTNNNGSANAPSPGIWYSILVVSGGTANLTYTTVRYGGADYSHPYYVGGNVYGYGGTINLDHCTLAYGNGYGIRGVNGPLTVQNSTIENNNNLRVIPFIQHPAHHPGGKKQCLPEQ